LNAAAAIADAAQNGLLAQGERARNGGDMYPKRSK
jgi:hypothetical protein